MFVEPTIFDREPADKVVADTDDLVAYWREETRRVYVVDGYDHWLLQVCTLPVGTTLEAATAFAHRKLTGDTSHG